MKCCVIIYHSDALKIYQRAWINQCLDSIAGQTHKKYDVMELCYDGSYTQLAKNVNPKTSYYFYYAEMENHIEAMNSLISRAFEMGYDVVYNTNLDDWYEHRRFEKQLEVIKEGYQLVSSNWHYTMDGVNVVKTFNYDKHDIEHELLIKNHNIVCHPGVAYHKSFWTDGLYYDNILGREDKILWQKALQQGKKIKILPEHFVMYRLHGNQVTKTYRS